MSGASRAFVVPSVASGGSAEVIDDATDVLVETTEPDRSEEDVPQAVVDRFEADIEFREQVTHVHPAIHPPGAAPV